MNILLVTSILAKDIVEENSLGNDVHVMPIQVAAFINSKSVALNLKENNIDDEDYDMVLLPGRSRGDAKIITEKTGIPAYKGPIHAQNLEYYLKNIEFLNLSTKKPANEIFKTEDKHIEDTQKEPELKVGEVGIGNYPKMIAEIQNVNELNQSEIKERANYFIESGADIIDLGIEQNLDPNYISETVNVLREESKVQDYDVPISVDTMDYELINAGLENDVDLILSIDEGNMEQCVTDKPVVLIPTNQKQGKYPRNPDERIEFLLDLKSDAKELGYKKLILDPLLEPFPNLSKSIESYNMLDEEDVEEPVMAGVGNVTEMVDADSVGVNALLAGLLKELSVDLFLQVEASRKTMGSVKELKTGIKMFEESVEIPKNLSKDLLILKEKRNHEIKYDINPSTEVLKPVKHSENELDDIYFRIFLDNGKINVIGHEGKKQKFVVKGVDPKLILDKILQKVKISRSHASYLGRELEKAKICSKLNKSYEQEEEIFDEFYKK